MKRQAGLAALRKRVDREDRALLSALGARMAAVERIGLFKIAQGLPVLQKGRWDELLRERLRLGERHGLDAEFIQKLYQLIHREALRIQKELVRQAGGKSRKRKSKSKKARKS